MKELIDNINNHKFNNNMEICYKLTNFILNANIKSEEELKTIEDKHFNTTSLNLRNEILYNSHIQDITWMEKFDDDLDIKAKIIDYTKAYENSNDELEKAKYLIFIYDLKEWEFDYPYTAYKLIISDKLK